VKNPVEEFSRLILVILVAILLLQIVTKGNGIGWITSFFQVAGTSSNPSTPVVTPGGGTSIKSPTSAGGYPFNPKGNLGAL
jgi:hypothetical protein